jgi:DNA (cytosine-5)-methyltransferase 1
MSAYYNEFDPFAAAWLRELIKAGHIAPGDVDERSIKDVKADDLRGYTQCHFFAGIGVWSHALRSAGWSDERPVWTGSCPCQPFSAAGKGGGFDDERHLWPDFFRLIAECRPDVVLGEQVASKDGLGWLDLVYADREGADYAVGAVDTCAAGFGAPHIRQRLYWTGLRVGDAKRAGLEGHAGYGDGAARRTIASRPATEASRANGLADADGGLADADGRDASAEREQRGGQQRQQQEDGRTGLVANAKGDGHERRGQLDQSTGRDGAAHAGADGGLADAKSEGRPHRGARAAQPVAAESSGSPVSPDRPGPTNGIWRDADWLGCRDGKWRPVKPGTFPLAHAGAYRNRVGLLRGAGNAVNLTQAQAFVEAVMSCS